MASGRGLVAALVLLTTAIIPDSSTGAGDFGLPYTVPGFDATFRSSIGSGVVSVVKANATLVKYDASLDRSGATGVLFGLANNLTTPLNRVLGHVAAAFGGNSTDTVQTLLQELQSLEDPTSAALEAVSEAVGSLDGVVAPRRVESLTANVSTIATQVSTLVRNVATFSGALRKVEDPESSYNASSIASLIDSDMVQSLTSPVRAINVALGDISKVFVAIGKDRTDAIAHEVATNTSVRNAQQDLSNHFATVERSVSETIRQMELQTNGTVRQVGEEYNRTKTRLADAADEELVQTFAEMVASQGLEHNRLAGELFRELSANYSRTLQGAADEVAAQLSAATAALIDEATVSDGPTADRCLQRHVTDFRQGPYSVSRLSGCYQADVRTLPYLQAASGNFLDQLRGGAAYAAQTQSICGSGASNCTTKYIEALPTLGPQLQDRLKSFESFLRTETAALSERYAICAAAIRVDIDSHVKSTEEKFKKCLTGGN
ncbi:uncharacterized protein LOC131207965 [Anopheles bellator]|uniref:uncharacterized protein LOC131207965 n=1 Tax=Anopheles bellator TaxID=139047 RepID=UPI002648EF5D|nr:uncharacterized protein LOC131207965 [Anopheles bellator]